MALSTTPLDARLRLSFRSVPLPQPALAFVAALAAGASLTLAAQPLPAARMSIGVGGKADLPALARLLRSDAVATAVIRDLRLHGVSPSRLRARLHVTPRPSVPALDVRYDDPSQPRAQRIAQDIGLVFSQQVLTRFHGETNASISEPPVPAGTLARPWARNLLLAGAAGVALAALVAFVAARPAFGRGRDGSSTSPERARRGRASSPAPHRMTSQGAHGVRRPRWGTMSASAPTSHRKD